MTSGPQVRIRRTGTDPRATPPESRPQRHGTGDALDAHREAVLRILARGEDMSAAAIASEVELEATQVSSLLTRLEHDGQATRTASGGWRAEPATQAKTEPRPSPKEPEQDG